MGDNKTTRKLGNTCMNRRKISYYTVRGEICILKEIIIQRKNFSIQIYDKKSSLPEEIIEWQRLKRQDKKYINQLKKQGESIQYFKVMKDEPTKDRKTLGFHYKLYSHKNFTYNQRLNIVNSILNNRKHNCGVLLGDYIEAMQVKSNVGKRTTDTLFDAETILLGSLGEYLMRATKDSSINYGEDIIRIRNTEVATFGEYIRSKGDSNYIKKGKNRYIWNMNIATKESMKRFKKRYSSETKKWEKSKTYKMNMIYSYDNNREGKLQHKRQGLINPNKPYISEWCVVDTDNVFKFNNNNYKISEQALQYSIRTKKPNHDDYKNDYQMDKILVYEQDDNLFFFDQNIDRISSDKITRV